MGLSALEAMTKDRDYWKGAYQTLTEQTGRDLNDGLGLDPRRTPPHITPPHTYEPHREYPWFCRHCGYGQTEVAMHGVADHATAQRAPATPSQPQPMEQSA